MLSTKQWILCDSNIKWSKHTVLGRNLFKLTQLRAIRILISMLHKWLSIHNMSVSQNLFIIFYMKAVHVGTSILSHRVPKIEFDDIKWNGNPKIIINNMFQNLSQAVFCLGSQKREEIRYFSSRLQPRSFQHCTALFSSCSRWSRSVALVLGWIELWIFM